MYDGVGPVSRERCSKRHKRSKGFLVSLFAITCIALTVSSLAVEYKEINANSQRLQTGTQKVRRQHGLDTELADKAALATVIGVGVHTIVKNIATKLRNATTLTDEKLKILYKKALEDQKEWREKYNCEVEAKEKLLADNKQLNSKCGKLEKSIESSHASMDELRGSIRFLEEKNKKGDTTVGEETKMRKKLQAEQMANEQKISDFEGVVSDLKSQVSKSKADIEAQRKHIKDIESELAKTKHQLEVSSDELKVEHVRAKANSSDLLAARREIEQLRKRIAELEKELQATKELLEKSMAMQKLETSWARHNHTELVRAQKELLASQSSYDSITAELVKAKSAKLKNIRDIKENRVAILQNKTAFKFPKLPWQEIGVTGGVLGLVGAGTYAGLRIGDMVLKGRAHLDPDFTPPQLISDDEAPPPPPPVMTHSYDNCFGDNKNLIQVQPCPLVQKENRLMDWKTLLIIFLLAIILIYLIYNYCCGRRSNDVDVRRVREGFIRVDRKLEEVGLKNELYLEKEVKERVMQYLIKVDKALEETEVAIKQQELAAKEEKKSQVKEEKKIEETKEMKQTRTELQSAVEDALSQAEVMDDEPIPVEGAVEDIKDTKKSKKSKKKRVNAYKFVKALTLKSFNSMEVEETKVKMAKEFAEEEKTLDRSTVVDWQGNEFDEVQFYRTHLHHVKTRVSDGKASPIHDPVVPGAEKKKVKDVAHEFERLSVKDKAPPMPDQAARKDRYKASPRSVSLEAPLPSIPSPSPRTKKAMFNPSKRLHKLFREYMNSMKKKRSESVATAGDSKKKEDPNLKDEW